MDVWSSGGFRRGRGARAAVLRIPFLLWSGMQRVGGPRGYMEAKTRAARVLDDSALSLATLFTRTQAVTSSGARHRTATAALCFSACSGTGQRRAHRGHLLRRGAAPSRGQPPCCARCGQPATTPDFAALPVLPGAEWFPAACPLPVHCPPSASQSVAGRITEAQGCSTHWARRAQSSLRGAPGRDRRDAKAAPNTQPGGPSGADAPCTRRAANPSLSSAVSVLIAHAAKRPALWRRSSESRPRRSALVFAARAVIGAAPTAPAVVAPRSMRCACTYASLLAVLTTHGALNISRCSHISTRAASPLSRSESVVVPSPLSPARDS
ncbi:hypothetical protein P154DRAFT_611778 [Amniculicola lignicola CBS 123094]|uniref:Uncharacterized protein n=1 Tax=Amniculicola lignicola CBS 123094 TaxID=1392246 RepID=A0A6A5X168_9PLEO|nr:hypothetical protein P154DRAFT_611778 [Amniculicola lignicola CBS 123094]